MASKTPAAIQRDSLFYRIPLARKQGGATRLEQRPRWNASVTLFSPLRFTAVKMLPGIVEMTAHELAVLGQLTGVRHIGDSKEQEPRRNASSVLFSEMIKPSKECPFQMSEPIPVDDGKPQKPRWNTSVTLFEKPSLRQRLVNWFRS